MRIWKRIAALGVLALSVTGCTTLEKPFNSAVGAVFGSSEFQPERYREVPWDMATNPAFKDQLRYKKFFFRGVYQGMENRPERWEQVAQHFTVKVCEDRSRQSCTSKVAVHQLYTNEVLAIPKGTPVWVYGEILEVAGVDIGDGVPLTNRDGSFDGVFLIKARKIIPQ